jgi:hypothetical protein
MRLDSSLAPSLPAGATTAGATTAGATTAGSAGGPWNEGSERWQPILDALDTLVARCAAEGIPAANRCDDGASPEQLALGRLLSGGGDLAADELMLGVPVRHGRIVVTAGGDRALLQQVLGAERGVRSAWHRGSIAILVRNSPRRAGGDRARSEACRIAALLVRAASQATVGISGTVDDAAEIRRAYDDACDAARLAVSTPARVVWAETRWADIVLARLAQQLAHTLPQVNPLRLLLERDAREHTRLFDSLTTWLRNDRNTAATALQLRVHPNTLRYRLRRAQELCGLTLDDPAQRLVVELVARTVGSVSSAGAG